MRGKVDKGTAIGSVAFEMLGAMAIVAVAEAASRRGGACDGFWWSEAAYCVRLSQRIHNVPCLR